MEVLGIAGAIGMLVGVGMSGYNSISQTSSLQASIAQMQDTIQSFTNGYNSLLAGDSAENQRLISDMSNDVDAITQLSQQANVEKTQHAATYRSIQLAGILMVSFIAFIFILKIFGFYDVVQQVLLFPFHIFTKK